MKIDIKARLKNWTFWVAIGALISAVLVDLGYIEAPDIVEKYMNLIYPIAIAFGIVADTSTKGLFDKKDDA